MVWKGLKYHCSVEGGTASSIQNNSTLIKIDTFLREVHNPISWQISSGFCVGKWLND